MNNNRVLKDNIISNILERLLNNSELLTPEDNLYRIVSDVKLGVEDVLSVFKFLDASKDDRGFQDGLLGSLSSAELYKKLLQRHFISKYNKAVGSTVFVEAPCSISVLIEIQCDKEE